MDVEDEVYLAASRFAVWVWMADNNDWTWEQIFHRYGLAC